MMAVLLDEYQERAETTAFYPFKMQGAHPVAISYCTLGLNGESGEAAEVVKKTWRNGGGLVHLNPRQRLLLLDEVGDTMWYCALLSKELNASLSSVAQWNLFKLAKRAELGKEGWDEDKKEELLEEFWSEIDKILRG